MNTPSVTLPSSGIYVPGHAKRKLAMVLCGVVLFSLGVSQLWTPVRLMVFGKKAKAEATQVVKTKEGVPDLVLTDDLQIQANLESQDRSSIFWNDFRFHLDDGRAVDIRATVGSQLKPLFPLIDADGLPTTEPICYDPADPKIVAFPLLISTWFAPGVMAIIGLACALIGAVLRYWANKPIELPHLPPVSAAPTGNTR
ncbi:MAG: hypothetical protein PHQ12_00705 [Chthoniobacteraceae bacterium]|nr:hypothetical protein [Chthoniobacteraceae bacterium]